MVTLRLLLGGFGNVNRNLARLLVSQRALLRAKYDLTLTIVGVADTSGARYDQAGIEPQSLLDARAAGRRVAQIGGVPGQTVAELVRRAQADVLLGATPVSLADGEPGLSAARLALQRGMSVVLADKGPLALAYQELAALSDLGAGADRGNARDWPALRFSAGVGGALPTINLGMRDLAGARVLRVEAVLNGTTQGILRRMEQGTGYAEALAAMQAAGIAETDPTLDVEGYDAAAKLTIVANAVLGHPCTIHDVARQGILGLTADDLRAARARGAVIVLLGLAEPAGDGYTLSVAPSALPADHPLARMSGDEMGIVYHTDIAGRLAASSLEVDATPTAAAMLRDLIGIAGR